jgi:hypothetical protein
MVETTKMMIKRNLEIRIPKSERKGAALLVVLFVVMTITIVSLGFLSRSNVELACGRNMVMRTQMDYLADSGLEHARGLLLNPDSIDLGGADYWAGATAQQLTSGNDYYDTSVVRDSIGGGFTNYTINCTAYRLDNGQRTAQSSLSALLSVPTGGIRLALAVSHTIVVESDAQIDIVDGAGAISTNHTDSDKITIKDNAIVDCDVYVGVGGDPDNVINIVGNGQITGTTAALDEAVDIPNPAIPDLGSSVGDRVYLSGTTVISSDFRCASFKIDNNAIVRVSGNVRIRVDDDLIIQSNAQLKIDGGSTLTIYTEKKFVVVGNAQVNVDGQTPSRLIVYHKTNNDFMVKDNSKLYATVAAKEAMLEISVYAEAFGTFKANYALIKDNGKLHGLFED